MPTPLQAPRTEGAPPVVLFNDAALDLGLDADFGEAQVIVAGNSLVRLALAELSHPGARIVWADFRKSASLRSVQGEVRDLGGLDLLVLAADGRDHEAMFALMCAILTFLPHLAHRPEATIRLSVGEGPAVGSLQAFLLGLEPKFRRLGIALKLDLAAPTDRSA